MLPLHLNNDKLTHLQREETDVSQNSDHLWKEDGGGLPLYSANPQCPGDDNLLKSPAPIRTSFSSSNKRRKIPLMMIGFVLVGIGAIYTSRETVNSAAEHVSLLERNRQRIDQKLKKAEEELGVLRRQVSAMDIMQEKEKTFESSSGKSSKVSNYRALHELHTLQNRLKEQKKRAVALKKTVQTSSLAEIKQKFGIGSHHVEIELVFPDGHDGPTKFVIEMAPTEVMPHSIQTFLEMVSTGLLDGCSFILNALHVIKAAPLPYDGSSAKKKAKEFSENGLESVAFKEYSDSYPHKQYTVGFAADGSPSFYINTEDNTEIHVGDPCFGKVISGFDAVKRLEASPTRNGIWFEKRIGIKSARIIPESEKHESSKSGSVRTGTRGSSNT